MWTNFQDLEYCKAGCLELVSIDIWGQIIFLLLGAFLFNLEGLAAYPASTH